MKNEGQIRQKLKQVLFRHLKLRLEANFRPRPVSCQHNEQTHTVWQGTEFACLRICQHPDRKGLVCDERFNGTAQAQSCPLWQARQTKEGIKSEFAGILRRPRHEVAVEFPDAAALMWALDEDTAEAEVAPVLAEASGERVVKVEHPWYKRFLLKWLGGKDE